MEYSGRDLEEDQMKEIKTQIIVATHKKYEMPEYKEYLPLQVGTSCTEEDFGYCKDNTGDNISEKNPYYCELTGLYWAWKNLDSDYLGIAHYRRYLTAKKNYQIAKCRNDIKKKLEYVLAGRELRQLELRYDIIVPARRHYIIETLYSHYSHSHYEEHLDIARQILKEKYPQYLETFDKVMKARSGYMFNMFIMRKALLDEYCTWLFDILFELEQRVNMEGLSMFQSRLFGRVSELLFNVWLIRQIETNGVQVREVGCMNIGKTDWTRKIKSFLAARFFHKKYESSF